MKDIIKTILAIIAILISLLILGGAIWFLCMVFKLMVMVGG